MRTGGLTERIAAEVERHATGSPEQVRLLDDLARALQATADVAQAIRPEPSRLEVEMRSGEPHVGMPQILKSMELESRHESFGAELHGRMRRLIHRMKRSLASPSVVASALGCTAAIGLYFAMQPFGSDAGEQAMASIATATPVITAPRTNKVRVENVRPVSAVAEEPSSRDRLLLEGAARLIVRGDLAGARRILVPAAESGSTTARFALAETFDPNMLAAWGMMQPNADVTMARTLYSQALAAGEARAARRLEALNNSSD